MFDPAEVFGPTLTRTTANYHFKVQSIDGNTVRYIGHGGLVKVYDLKNPMSENTLEDEYSSMVDNLFIAININGTYFFYTKVSNTAQW